MINLAPWRYRRVLAVDGGPVERIESGVVTVLGETRYQANAYLKSGLRREAGDKVLYGTADGSGTDLYPEVARHKAISESLERWAHATHAAGRRDYGFDIDPSSNGMAAFPALFTRRVRERAWQEAVERHAVMSWWGGAYDAVARTSPWAGVDAYEIETSEAGTKVALLHATAGQQMHAYGHAAAATFAEAMWRASIELVRAQSVISGYERRHHENPVNQANAPLFERRCLYFASPEGHARFKERMAQPKSRTCKARVVFNGEIPGQWSEYACVWRVLFEPTVPGFLDNRNDIFFW